MINLSEISPKKLTKIGIVVTIFVFTAACAHEAVAPANNDVQAVNDVTPPPLRDSAPIETVSSPKPVKRVSMHRSHKKSSLKKKNHVIARGIVKKHKRSKHVEALATASISMPAPPPPPAAEISAAHGTLAASTPEEQPSSESFWEKVEEYLSYVLMAGGAVGIVLFVARLERKRVKGRRKIIFN